MSPQTDNIPSVVAPAELRLAVLSRLVEEAAEEMADKRLNVSVRVHVTEAKNYARGGYSSGHTRELEAAIRAESVAAPPWNDADMNMAHGIGYEAGRSDALHAPPALDAARLAEIVSDSLAASTEGTEWAEAPEPSDEPGSPYVLRLTNEILSRLSGATPASGEPAAPREEQP